MGWGVQVPLPDERMQKTIDTLGLTHADLKVLYKRFLKCDDECVIYKSGSIDKKEFYESFHEKESAFGDAIFNLIDCDNSGVLDFGEYVAALSTYCMFGRDEVLKFCFFVFDDDKNGTIEGPELDSLLELLHADGQTNNMKIAMEKFNFNADGKIDFDEFKMLNAQFPTLLYPAFRMQENMRKHTLGKKWWEKKLAEADEKRKDAALGVEKLKLKQQKEKEKANKKIIQAKMGFASYYLQPWRRKHYMEDDDDDDSEEDEMTAEEVLRQQAKLKEAMEEAKKRAWKKYKKKKDKNIVSLGKRKPLDKEERLERARRRRERDMKDRPGRR